MNSLGSENNVKTLLIYNNQNEVISRTKTNVYLVNQKLKNIIRNSLSNDSLGICTFTNDSNDNMHVVESEYIL